MADVFSDLRKAVIELFQARSERPLTLLEVPPVVSFLCSYTKEQGKTLERKGRGKEKLLR